MTYDYIEITRKEVRVLAKQAMMKGYSVGFKDRVLSIGIPGRESLEIKIKKDP